MPGLPLGFGFRGNVGGLLRSLISLPAVRRALALHCLEIEVYRVKPSSELSRPRHMTCICQGPAQRTPRRQKPLPWSTAQSLPSSRHSGASTLHVWFLTQREEEMKSTADFSITAPGGNSARAIAPHEPSTKRCPEAGGRGDRSHFSPSVYRLSTGAHP